MEGEGKEAEGNEEGEEEGIQPDSGKPQTASSMSAAGTLPHVSSRHPPPCLLQTWPVVQTGREAVYRQVALLQVL